MATHVQGDTHTQQGRRAVVSDADTGAAGRSQGEMAQLSAIELNVNDQVRRLEVDPRTSLLDALREHLRLSGTKKGVITGSAAPARC